MTDNEYNNYMSAIQKANDNGDKAVLRYLKAWLIGKYGRSDARVDELLGMFRYQV